MKLRIARKVLYGRAADPAQPWLRIVRTHRWITVCRAARRLRAVEGFVVPHQTLDGEPQAALPTIDEPQGGQGVLL